MSREHSAPSSGAVVFGGLLKDELRRHAYERCRHFFLFLFHYKALIDYLNGPPHNKGWGMTDALFVNASHQIDTGFRSEEKEHYAFNAKDPNVVNKSCSDCGNTDAAHFCNLGIKVNYQSAIAGVANHDQKAFHLYKDLAVICGNTRLLPQRINIGPDKKIDKFHGELAVKILSGGGPPVTLKNLDDYLAGAKSVFEEYKKKQVSKGNLGIAACVDAYLTCYANDRKSLWSFIASNVRGDVIDYGLTVGNYLTWL
jgi:hypothetical protein